MIVKIHSRDFSLSEALRDHTESKVRLALGLYTEKVRRADVVLSDINGPKGGADMKCRIATQLSGHSSIVAEETAVDMYVAINMCAHKIRRATIRRFDRALQRRKLHDKRRSISRPDYGEADFQRASF